MTTIAELSTTMSVEDLWDLLEVVEVDAHNARIVNDAIRKMRERP